MAKQKAVLERKLLQNRIVSYELVDPRTLRANPLNWRIHPEAQEAALESIMRRVGWLDEVRVNKRTGNIINGHLRLKIALKNAEPKIPVVYVDISQEEEHLALATFDSVTGLAVQDTDALLELVRLTEPVWNEDKPISDLLQDLIAGSEMAEGEDSGTGMKSLPSNDTAKNQVRPVLYPVQVSLLEKALALTENMNRGEALMEICQAYVETKGQFNSESESGTSAEDVAATH